MVVADSVSGENLLLFHMMKLPSYDITRQREGTREHRGVSCIRSLTLLRRLYSHE